MRRSKNKFVNPSWNDLSVLFRKGAISLDVEGAVATFQLVRMRNTFSPGKAFSVVYSENGREKLLEGIADRSDAPITFKYA